MEGTSGVSTKNGISVRYIRNGTLNPKYQLFACSHRHDSFTSDINLSFPFLIHILFHAQLSTVVGVSWWHVVALVETWDLEDWGNQAQVSSSWLLYIPNDEVWDASCKQAYLHSHNL